MLPTSNGLIYSPKHYSIYTRDGEGAGAWVGEDVAKWNMAWLSIPTLDLYLTQLSHKDILAGFDRKLFGSVIAMARSDMTKQFPGLRTALLSDPRQLLPVIDNLSLIDSPAGVLGGQFWLDTVRSRVQTLIDIGKLPTSSDVKKLEKAAVDNIIRYDFSAKKRLK